MSHRQGIGWGVIQQDQRERNKPITTGKQKEEALVRAIRRNTTTTHGKTKRKLLMFDGDGKLEKPDESKRGRDGSATNKRDRSEAGRNGSRESTNEGTTTAREKCESNVPTPTRGSKIRQHVSATVQRARPRGPKGTSRKKVRWARQLTAYAEERARSSPQECGNTTPLNVKQEKIIPVDQSSPQGVERAPAKLGAPWKITKARRTIEQPKLPTPEHLGQMCPTGLATRHPAFQTLQQYATKGCPAKTGRHWTKEEIHAAVERGNHISARSKAAIEAYQLEIKEKVARGQAKVVLWDDIKDNPPRQLKISPLAMVPHKSRLFRAILDLSFSLKLSTHHIPSVNESTEKASMEGTLDQLGTVLPRVIAALAQTAEDEVVFFSKFNIKDGFWRLVCKKGA